MGLIKITNGNFDHVSWIDSGLCDFVLNNNVDTWKISMSSNLTQLDNFQSVMQPEEIAGANRFFHTTDKNRSIITRGAVRKILGKYLDIPPATLEFGIVKNKKPYVLNPGKVSLHFNISHSANYIILAVADLEVGADIELLNYVFNYKEIMHDYFSADEVSFIKQQTPVERFFLLWTRKEALIKATGKGLVDNIELLPGLDGVYSIKSEIISSSDNWLINSFKFDREYMASIACNPSVNKFGFFNCNFDAFVDIF